MFREIAYIACILATAVFGTELLFRFKPSNDITDSDYILQSNMVMASSAVGIIFSLFVLRNMDRISKIRMQGLTVLILSLFITAIALRSRYRFTMPLGDSKINMYTSTSVFLCVTMATWSLFCFFKSPEPLIQPMPLSERPRTNTENDVHSVLRYDAEIDYTLPSYSELPSPPAYQKITIPDNAVTVDNRHIPTLELATTPNAESSSISRSNYDNSNSEIDQNTNNQQQYNESNEASLTSTADSVVLSKSDDNNKLAAGSSNCTLTALAESSSADIRKD